MAKQIHSVAQMRKRARARMPRMVFDFLDGGAGTESGLARNEAAIQNVVLVPRILKGCATRSTKVTLFGREWAYPVAMAPIGMGNLMWPGMEQGLAKAAVAQGIPHILSTAGTTSVEDIAKLAPGHNWFQLYVKDDIDMTLDLVDRAAAAGCEVLFPTVDLPVGGRRVRDLVNGFTMPFAPSPLSFFQFALRPEWSLKTLQAGIPKFANIAKYNDDKTVMSLANRMASQTSAKFDWDVLKRIRERWKGKLVIKGVAHPDDARMAVAMGCDGVVVSNHGGRQFDSGPAPIDMLPRIRAAVPEGFVVMMDSGLRSGEDIAKAIALGADFCLMGRAFVYASVALGPDAGPVRLMEILRTELDLAMAQMGCSTLPELRGIERWPLQGQ